MPAAGVIMIVAVVLIVAALVYYLRGIEHLTTSPIFENRERLVDEPCRVRRNWEDVYSLIKAGVRV